jgi:hypothetical protein
MHRPARARAFGLATFDSGAVAWQTDVVRWSPEAVHLTGLHVFTWVVSRVPADGCSSPADCFGSE